MELSSSILLRDVGWFETDVFGLRTAGSLELEPIGSPKTSVSNHLTPLNNPGDERILFNRSGSLKSRMHGTASRSCVMSGFVLSSVIIKRLNEP